MSKGYKGDHMIQESMDKNNIAKNKMSRPKSKHLKTEPMGNDLAAAGYLDKYRIVDYNE